MTVPVPNIPDRFADPVREARTPEEVVVRLTASFRIVDHHVW